MCYYVSNFPIAGSSLWEKAHYLTSVKGTQVMLRNQMIKINFKL
jgi:hypothetical protein